MYRPIIYNIFTKEKTKLVILVCAAWVGCQVFFFFLWVPTHVVVGLSVRGWCSWLLECLRCHSWLPVFFSLSLQLWSGWVLYPALPEVPDQKGIAQWREYSGIPGCDVWGGCCVGNYCETRSCIYLLLLECWVLCLLLLVGSVIWVSGPGWMTRWCCWKCPWF